MDHHERHRIEKLESEVERALATASTGNVASVSGAAPITSTGGNNPIIGITPATPIAAGSMSAADKAEVNALAASSVGAGAGLTGGGPVDASPVLNVGANPDGSIVVNPNDVQVGVLATDAQHGARGGGTQHALVTVAVAGFMSAADKSKLDGIAPGAAALTASPPADVTKAAAAVGVATTAARADHKHDITTAAPPAGAVAAGNATAEGVATTLARSDHQHAVATAAAGTINVGDASAAGAAATFARSDHVHALPAPAAPVNVDKSAASAGAAATVARSDHKHDASTATAVDITDTTNAEGVAATLSRSDHAHAHGIRGGGTLHAVATPVVAGFMSAADKTKLDGITNLAVPTVLLWGTDTVGTTTTTRFLLPGFDTVLAPTTTVQFRVPFAGTLRNMRVRQGTGGGNGNAIVYTVRKNSAATALAVSIASTANDASDLADTVAVAAGDLLDIQVTKALALGGGQPSTITVSVELST